MIHSLDVAEIEKVRNLVRSALDATSEPQSREALRAGLQVLDTLASPAGHDPQRRYAGSIDYSFYDEECAPYCREIDVRVYYSWSDYHPGDEPSSNWGASIEDVELVAVRYFDQQGEVATLGEHHAELARELLSVHDEKLIEACTEDGCRKGIGAAPGWYRPAMTRTVDSSAKAFAARMAPSLSTRDTDATRRRLG